MLAEPPEDQSPNKFDLSALSARIREVKNADVSISQKHLAKMFVNNSILPLLNTPQIYQMLQNPLFVEEFTNLLVAFIGTVPKIAPKVNE